jgi:hypothetical protein
MVEYKLYIMGETGLIARGVWFEAPSDEQAILQARALARGAPTELWDGQRLVEEHAGQAAA